MRPWRARRAAPDATMSRAVTTGPDVDPDLYWEVCGHVRAEVREKGSRFLGECFPVKSEESARAHVYQAMAKIRSRLDRLRPPRKKPRTGRR